MCGTGGAVTYAGGGVHVFATGWRNWAGNQEARPAKVVAPADAAGVADAVMAAAAEGRRVKAAGSGHSFTGVAVTDGHLMRLDRMTDVVAVDPPTGLVTVQAGMPIHRLNAVLAEHGLAMTNLGDVDRQTVSGAIATGTHGTGARFGGLATQVHGLELVLADGSFVRCSADERPEIFDAARIGLGALGVVTALTLRCEPAYLLRAVEEPMPLDRVLDGLDAFVDGNDHFEFYWFPHTKLALTKRNNRVHEDTPPQPVGAFRGWLDDEFLSNTVFGLVNRFCAAMPRLTPAVNNVSARALSARTYVDASYRVFCSPRRVRFKEMEYALPRNALRDVLREVDAWLRRSGELVPFPVEVRFAAADDVWLSTAYERESTYLAVHQYHPLPHGRYFDAVERIAVAAGGRPHWGKLHSLDAAALAERHPRLADFVAVRDKLDPNRVFGNAYLDRVLG
ncbi:MAG: FAD-binding protein [Streptosporangiales bacterium]|nr:FAD-binding protein [Streptosporangiales bacterium]